MAKEKKKRAGLTAFSIIFLIIILLAVLTLFLPEAIFAGDAIVDGSGVVAASFKDVILAPVLGFENAADVSIFILILGGLLAVVAKTGALETGVKVLVKKLKGNELVLIPILMFIFSIAGTTYGFLEESVPFYALLSFTMVAAGMDTIVASATVLLGAGAGVLGSTINPFATGAAIAAAQDAGVTVNQGTIMILGVILWLVSLGIAMFFVMKYAKKVKKDKGSTFLSLQEQKVMDKKYSKEEKEEAVKLSGKQKATLILFAITFVVMILGFIPWVDLGVISAEVADSGTHWSAFLTGNCFGYWWFEDAAAWFFLMTIIIGVVNRFSEKDLVETFVAGASDILSVILIIAVARGVTVLMKSTYLDNYILINAAKLLEGTSVALFAPLNFILQVFLSVLVPSSSGLAGLSTPIIAPLSQMLGYNANVTIMELVAANGLVNLITPTCGAIMGGLALAGVEYSTWFKWAFKVVLTIGLVVMVILTLAAVIL